MCGRIHVPGETQFLRLFDGYQIGDLGLQESWNLAPTQSVLVIRAIEDQRRASPMRRSSSNMSQSILAPKRRASYFRLCATMAK